MSRNNYKDIERVHYNDYFDKLPEKMYTFVLTASDNTDFTIYQPANTILNNIQILCTTAPVINSGNVSISINHTGYNNPGIAHAQNIIKGTATGSGGDIIQGHTGFPVNSVVHISPSSFHGKSSGSNTTSSAYTSSRRLLYVRVTTSVDLNGNAGSFTLVPRFTNLHNALHHNNELYAMTGTGTPAIDHDSNYAGIKLTTSAATSNQNFLFTNTTSHNAISSGLIHTGAEIEFETTILVPNISTLDFGVVAGLTLTIPSTLTNTITMDNDKAMFIFGANAAFTSGTLSSNANILFVYSIGGTDYVTDLGIPCLADHEYNLKICFNKSRKMKIYVNDSHYGLVTTSGTLGTSVTDKYQLSNQMTSVSLYPIVGIQNTNSNARSLVVNFIKLSRSSRKRLS